MRPQNIITVDWEDWFHICEVDHLLPRDKWDSYPSILPEATTKLLAFFKQYQINATFFILGYCADRYPKLVQEIAEAGHEIAYHSYSHSLVYKQTAKEFSRDIIQGKQQLEPLCQQQINGFRAPQWSLNKQCPWGLEELAKAGYTYDSSHAPFTIIGDPAYPEQVHKLTTKRGILFEFPPLILNILGLNVPAGGGWGLKTWPVTAIKGKIEKLNQQQSPATLFIHPVDMIDNPPPVKLPFLKKTVTRFGLRKTAATLQKLLKTTDFISIQQYMEQIK
jgi:polysaccharide deacetylase family protein (PEP-CTERM system associated)